MSETFLNKHVRSVTVGKNGAYCQITPVAYAWCGPWTATTFFSDTEPIKHEACIRLSRALAEVEEYARITSL
jgi:hypothetical protein